MQLKSCLFYFSTIACRPRRSGKLKASHNAFRHGLSLPLRRDTETSAKADAIPDLLAREQASEPERMAATEVALAQLDLQRIRAVRAELIAELDLTSGDIDSLRRLAALTATGGWPTLSAVRPRESFETRLGS